MLEGSQLFPCDVESSDSLRVDKSFRFNEKAQMFDMEFCVTQGKVRSRSSVWLSFESVLELHAQLGRTLQDFYTTEKE